MSATTALLRENPGLLAMAVALAIGTLVFGTLGIIMARSGASLRPIAFVGGLFALVLLPQFAYHLGVATGAVPRRNLTWLPAAEQARVYGWVEREPALAVRDGVFADLGAVFGPGVDLSLGSNLRAAGGVLPFGSADAAYMAVLPPDGSAIIARFVSSTAAEGAARDFAQQALGTWPDIGADGLRMARRPAGDIVKLGLVGRTLVVVSATDERALTRHLHAIGAIAPAQAPSDAGSERYWLYRPGVLPALLVGLVVFYVFVFFKGAAWAGAVPAVTGIQPATTAELRQRLLEIDALNVPLTIVAEEGGRRLVATWRFADARWLDLARARQMRYTARVILNLDPQSHIVRVTEQMTHFDAAAGLGDVALEWCTMRGVTFFQVERGRVFGLQFDANGRPQPKLDYAWRFDAQEMKAPLIDAVTHAGWQWRPTPWSGPEWLRWLTD